MLSPERQTETPDEFAETCAKLDAAVSQAAALFESWAVTDWQHKFDALIAAVYAELDDATRARIMAAAKRLEGEST